MTNTGFVKAYGISYVGTLPKIKKSNDQLQPIYEAFTNALESIRLLDSTNNGKISVTISFITDMFSGQDNKVDLSSIIIEDSGIGFNKDEFERLLNLNDTGKGFFNKGSGRVQFLHFFDKTEVESTFKDATSTTGYLERKFTLSKSEAYLKNNAIVKKESLEEVSSTETKTKVIFKSPMDKTDLEYYASISVDELKQNLINRYLAFFCENQKTLPEIVIKKQVDNIVIEESKIHTEDIPPIDREDDLHVNYSRLSGDGKSIEKAARTEVLHLRGFKINKDKLKKNGLKLTSKGEVAKDIKLDSLLVDDHIDDNRYLFLLSGDYINNRDTDTRGVLIIPSLDEFRKTSGDATSLFTQEEIVLEDIRERANQKILEMWDEISSRTTEKNIEIEKLRAMFLLNPETIKEAKIKLNDTEQEILEKIYKVDAKNIAQKDAEIKKRVDNLDSLNPISKDFQEKFTEEINELTKAIPLQNRTELTHYVARRKLVLDLFTKILNRKLAVQSPGNANYDEALIHNLLFQKGSDRPDNSDLWIINEDFIYFSGSSETRLSKLEINGQKVFKEKFNEEEERYLQSLGEDRKIKRPDVLLFPDEGKCIIIEFKTPLVNVSEHLTQIDFYASLIRNYTIDEIQLTTFYGYLIGENIEPRDVLGRVSRYEHSYQLDYLYRPSENVIGFDGRSNGSIYTEVIKYSTLLERARRRNEIFISKL